MKLCLIILLCLYFIDSYFALTESLFTSDCFGIPKTPLKVIGARVLSMPEKGSKVCYYGPKTSDYYFYIKVNKLNLQRTNNVCPTFKLESYVRTIEDNDLERDIQIMYSAPESPRVIFEADCNNYEQQLNKVYQTFNPGDKIALTYNPGNQVAPSEAFEITLSAYLIGQSYSCPDSHYLCWSSSHVCLDGSLMCDNADNCYDNSDESSYKCTGRIGEMPLPLFVIVIIGCVLCLIFLVMVVVLLMRGQHNRRLRDEAKWHTAGDRNTAYGESSMPGQSYMS